MLSSLMLMTALAAASPATPPAPAWLTRAERTRFEETSRYEETLEDCRRLERGSPWIKVTSFGTSPEGRQLILVIASKDRAFDPRAAARTGKPVVLIQAGIHAGEIDGKDAGLMLLRDITTGAEKGLLDRAILLFLPIYNVDGHERFGPYNRINQNGPREAGWRTTSRNLNLNRDYVKADAVETRAWLSLFTSWLPDLVIDCHVTDGADYQYDITYWDETSPNSPAPVREWMARTTAGAVVPELSAGGHKPAMYVFLADDTDPSAGFAVAPPAPRFSTSYAALQNRAAFLIETHMLKDYGTRVRATYDTLRALLRAVNEDGAALKSAVLRADDLAAAPGGTVGLTWKVEPSRHAETFRGFAWRREPSEVSGTMRIIYEKSPIEIPVDRLGDLAPAVEVVRPAAYLVPQQWTEAVDRLRVHGLRLERLTASVTLTVDGYRLSDPEWEARPFEGRHQVTYKTETLTGIQREFPAGTIVVPMDQRASAVAAHLLEPQGPDSLVAWGFLDAIFEQKEYGEAYVVEDLARRMLTNDKALRAEFEARLMDPNFASSSRQRLDFFFRRSPWWDDRIGLYPIWRLPARQTLPAAPLTGKP
jgi:murein tripeptide amidase MpaA